MPSPTRRVTRKLHIVDDDTGAVTEGQATWEEPGKPRRKGRRMSFTMIETSTDGITRLRLTGAEWTVLMHFIAALNADTGRAAIRVTDVARATGFRGPNVSRIVASLRDRKILFRESAISWRVNTHIAYRGEVTDWSQAYYSDPEPIWEVAP
jgi:hypothetical protein